ncbi:MAG: hypothetical protein OXM61_00455, partial [Candidatus Poribacteria bacterium]|nr:hypothetical protein [Candidatus Poribacteria bacterium]
MDWKLLLVFGALVIVRQPFFLEEGLLCFLFVFVKVEGIGQDNTLKRFISFVFSTLPPESFFNRTYAALNLSEGDLSCW